MVRTGGSSTRYFFNLKKRHHSNKYITKLRVENCTSTSSDEIFNEEHRYYKRLNTSSCTNPNYTRFDVFFDSSTLPKTVFKQKKTVTPHLKVFPKASLLVRMT